MLTLDVLFWLALGPLLGAFAPRGFRSTAMLACAVAALSVGTAVRLESVVVPNGLHLASAAAAFVAAALTLVGVRLLTEDDVEPADA